MTLVNNYGAASTYVKVASTTLTATTSTITFANIPQGYTDLRIIVSGNQYTSASYGDHVMRYNSDSGSNYSNYGMYSNTTQGASPIANYYIANQSSIGLGAMVDFTANSNTWVSHSKVDIMSYSNTTAYKTCLVANSMIQSGDYSRLTETVGTWRNTGAITAISIHAITDPPFNVGVTVNIYGIKAALFPKATGGDVIVNDGTYWYHAFRSTGVLRVNTALTADVLQIAGGGAGGSAQTGAYYVGTGGGAGGVSYLTSQSLTANTSYTATVGAGGSTRGQSYPFSGFSGSNSQFGSLTAAVGGGGGIYFGAGGQGINGGSGGGGGGQNNTPTPGLGTAGQGNNGGAGLYSGGGGGGAGAVGGNSGWDSAIYQAGVGGVGTTTYSSWGLATSTGQNVSGVVYFAGGGGGGFSDAYGVPSNYNNGSYGGGGIGGGGGANSPAGTNAQLPGNGITNTGGGGGGGGSNGNTAYPGGFNGATGGSGVIIVRYPI